MNNYFIKDGYQINDVSLTKDEISGQTYWTEDRIKASKSYQYSVYKLATKLSIRKKLSSLIDVGCGSGHKLAQIYRKNNKLQIIGIDQKNAIDFCSSVHQFGNWYIDDFENPSLDERIKGDLVICSDVIEHVKEPDVLLTYLKMRVKDDGYILISTPDRDILRGFDCYYSPNKHHIREWSAHEFNNFLTALGFTIEKSWHQLPVKPMVNRLTFNEIIKRIIFLKSPFFNYVVLLRK